MSARALFCTATLALLSGAASPVSETERNRAVATDFARLFYSEKKVREAFVTYVAPDYIQHNPGIPDGREAAIAALEPKFSRPLSRFDVKRIIVEGEYVVIHLRASADPAARGAAVADIYRLKDGRIAEHWDVLQPIPETSANPHPMF